MTINYNEFQAGQGVSAPDLNENFTLTNNALETMSTTLSSAIATLSSTTNSKAGKNGSTSEAFKVADATDDMEAVNLGQLKGMIPPVGSVIWYRGNSAPTGFLVCDGSYLPATYSALRAICGDYLPNLINRIIKGNQTVMQYDTTLWDSVVNLSHAHAVGNTGYPVESGYALGDHSHAVTLPTITLLPCIKY